MEDKIKIHFDTILLRSSVFGTNEQRALLNAMLEEAIAKAKTELQLERLEEVKRM